MLINVIRDGCVFNTLEGAVRFDYVCTLTPNLPIFMERWNVSNPSCSKSDSDSFFHGTSKKLLLDLFN